MSKRGNIIIIDDDTEDRRIFADLLEDINLPNKVLWFESTDDAFKHLKTTSEPSFMIFSEIAIPGRNGLEFKKNIDADPQLRKQSIPFIFMSSAATQGDVDTAYLDMTIQGFFSKGNHYASMRQMLKTIFDYWTLCRVPET